MMGYIASHGVMLSRRYACICYSMCLLRLYFFQKLEILAIFINTEDIEYGVDSVPEC